jgi:hypothetical protein
VSRDPANDNQHLPPWLRGVPLPPQPPGPAASHAPDAPAPWSDLPASSSTPSEDIPDWLKELSAATAEGASDLEAEPEPPRDLSSPISAESSAGELPELFRDSDQGRELAQSEASSLPDWLRGAFTETPAETPAGAETLPSWLTGLTPDKTDTTPPAQPTGDQSDTLPAWLSDVSPTGSAPTSGEEPSARPQEEADPLSGLPSPVEQADRQPSLDAAELDETGIPGWLRDIPADEIRRVMESDDEISVEPFSFGESATQQTGESGKDVPAWLAGISGDSGEAADSGPSWLGGLADDSAQQSSAANPPDVPLWLQDLDTPSREAAPSAPEGSSAENAAPSLPEPSDHLPSWQSEAEQASATADSLPGWLQDKPAEARRAQELPSWLQAEAPSTPPVEELPSWLQAEAPSTPPAEEPPSWLRLEPAPPAVPPTGAPSPSGDLPPWLNDAIASSPPDTTPVPPAPPSRPAASAQPTSAADDLPAWLRDDVPAPAEDLPDWLQAGPQAEPPRAEPTPAAEPARAEDLPDWLQAAPPAKPMGIEPAREAEPAAELPPWLRDEAGQPLPTAGAPGDTNLPEWLRGGAPIEPSTPALAEPVPGTSSDWLSSEPPAAPAPSAPTNFDWFEEEAPADIAGRAPGGENEFFGGAELPAWLRKAETEPTAEISPSDARSLDWLTKLGTHEEDTAGPAAASPAKLPLPPAPVRTQSQTSALMLLQRLTAQPYPDSAPLPTPAEPGLWQRIGLERLLYIVLLVVLLAALAVPNLAVGLQLPPESPGAAALFQQIDTLTDRDVVLIGYEWDARRISELKPLEQAVIGQLIQKHVKLVLVSTDPQGTLLLFDLRDQLEAAGYRGGGEDYILLGYKPGGELALRALAQDFQRALAQDFQGNDATIGALAGGLQTGKPLTKLSDFARILVLADEPSDVQAWVEQVHRSVPRTPLAFLLPAEAAPIVQPYLQPPRDPQNSPIYHLAGKQGALAYEQLRGAEHTPTVQIEREIGQQRLAMLVFIALLLAGGVIVAMGGALRRRAGT